VFRDYAKTSQVEEAVSVKLEVLTPVKKRVLDIVTPKIEFPLTPLTTVKSESVTFDLKFENEDGTKVTEHFVRRSKRRRIGHVKSQDD
jgi:hypothetical protein